MYNTGAYFITDGTVPIPELELESESINNIGIGSSIEQQLSELKLESESEWEPPELAHHCFTKWAHDGFCKGVIRLVFQGKNVLDHT